MTLLGLCGHSTTLLRLANPSTSIVIKLTFLPSRYSAQVYLLEIVAKDRIVRVGITLAEVPVKIEVGEMRYVFSYLLAHESKEASALKQHDKKRLKLAARYWQDLCVTQGGGARLA
ncbi:MAG: hypothetical protein KAV83_00045 [Desulfobacterales bacterium]|nr:hypothetical protein [Desulfobacterales bacterium]